MATSPSSPKREFPKFIDEPNVHDLEPNEQRTRSGSTAHKRSLSGSFFSRFPLLRTTSSEKGILDATNIQDRPPTGAALAGALQQKKSRKRKGSLRKVALLGGRDRKGSDTKSRSPLASPNSLQEPTLPFTVITDHEATPRQSHDHPTTKLPPPKWAGPRDSITSIDSSTPSVDPPSSVNSVMSPTAPTDASLTDDDESMAFPRLQEDTLHTQNPSNQDSYFPPSDTIIKGSSIRKTSPLATQSQGGALSPAMEEEWDYTETAYWGYVILIVTWLVFVIGMGSCFGVWSWSWDVGETPYAPPELEDDPTLPIVGYYPALMVLTAVMAWIWVLIAWIGLKYFRHADMKSDD